MSKESPVLKEIYLKKPVSPDLEDSLHEWSLQRGDGCCDSCSKVGPLVRIALEGEDKVTVSIDCDDDECEEVMEHYLEIPVRSSLRICFECLGFVMG